MDTMKHTLATIAGAIAALTLGAGAAHADDASFLSALADHGVNPTWTTPADAIVAAGHQICATGSAAGTVLGPADALGAPVVEIAHQELCP